MDPIKPTRRSLMAGGVALAALGAAGRAGAQGAAPGTLTYGISMTDLPLTTGQPDRGAGGYQFTGLTLYDPLVAWELDVADRPGRMVPGLATAWEADPADPKVWTFHLREGVAFHDGSTFDADAVIWNFDKVLNKEAPHFDQRQAAQVRPRLPGVASYRKLDAKTVQVVTKTPDSLFPYQMLWFLISSPAQYEKVGKDWAKFAFDPSGTGPFRLGQLVPRVRLELLPNVGYWNPKRVPKLAKLTLTCVPEDLARVNALLSGSVDLIESPAPDAVPRLKAAGMRVVGNETPHVWNYHLSMLEGSPWRDLRLRKAANLAIDRAGVVELMGGLAQPAVGQVQESSPWFGKPSFKIKTDVDQARKLVEEAGYSVKNPVKATVLIPTGDGADAVAADQRVRPAELGGGRHPGGVQDRRAGGGLHRVAPGRRGSEPQGRERRQHRLRHLGPVLRDPALLRFAADRPERGELEPLPQSRGRRPLRPGQGEPRCR